MGIPIPDSGSVTEDTDVVGGMLTTSGDIDYLFGDDTGDWTVVTNDTSLGYGSSFSMDADGNWVFSVDNDDPGIQALDSGDTLEFQYTVSSTNGDSTVTITVFGVDEPPCFVRGTSIQTPQGPRPIETLRAGDEVLTVDAGPVMIRWIGSRITSSLSDVDPEKLAPIEIAANAFGRGVPERTLRVSPLHRVLWKGPDAQLLFGVGEVFCAAKSLVNGTSIQRSDDIEVEYFHILLDEHHVIAAEGCETETLFPGRWGLAGFENAHREEIFSIFPELRTSEGTFGQTARPILKDYEIKLLGNRLAA